MISIILVLGMIGASCTRVIKRPDNGLDIINLNTMPGTAFDIRIIQDVYGPPTLIDADENALIYITDYFYLDEFLFSEPKPQYSERWYLLLRPSDISKMYYGEKRYRRYATQQGPNSDKQDFTMPQMPQSAANIKWSETQMVE